VDLRSDEVSNNLLQVDGKVTFNGHTHKEFVPQKTAAYVSQYDLHTGQLTVRETLNFAAHVQGVGSQYGTYISLLLITI
jgi:ABC-type multidrug transport system ATPase subunit